MIFILIIYGLPCINISLGLGSLHLFYSSIKLMEIEFFAEDRGTESTGMPMKIHVTETTKAQTLSYYQYSQNTEIDVKGKGMMKTYFL